MALELPPLPYAPDALAPHINNQTLSTHHGKHHQAYVTNGNKLIEGTEFADKPLEEIIKATAGKADKAGIFNNAAQVWNHTFYWNCDEAERRRRADRRASAAAIDATFGGFEKFKAKLFTQAGAIGSSAAAGRGWSRTPSGKLELMHRRPNAETPLTDDGVTPHPDDAMSGSMPTTSTTSNRRRGNYVKTCLAGAS